MLFTIVLNFWTDSIFLDPDFVESMIVNNLVIEIPKIIKVVDQICDAFVEDFCDDWREWFGVRS